MQPVLFLGAQGEGKTYVIDGITYRVPLLDASAHLQVDVLSSALPSGAALESSLVLIHAHIESLLALLNALDSVATDELDCHVEGTVELTSPTAVTSGKDTVASAGTHEQMANVPCKGVSIKALSTNTGMIYLGPDGVAAATGYQLAAGESIDIVIDNLNRIYIDAAVTGEGVTYLCVT
jgi:hypothetical protein